LSGHLGDPGLVVRSALVWLGTRRPTQSPSPPPSPEPSPLPSMKPTPSPVESTFKPTPLPTRTNAPTVPSKSGQGGWSSGTAGLVWSAVSLAVVACVVGALKLGKGEEEKYFDEKGVELSTSHAPGAEDSLLYRKKQRFKEKETMVRGQRYVEPLTSPSPRCSVGRTRRTRPRCVHR